MFDQINGLPVHALVLHAAVVFVPLLALGAVVYALIGPWRTKIGWALALLALIAPATTFVAKESGEKLYDRLIARGLNGRGKEILDDHQGFGTMTFWFALSLGVVSLIMLFVTRGGSTAGPKLVRWVLAVAMIVLAGFCGYYVFRTGDSGATAVWGSY